jgi:uncharacterized protein YjiS (DUF1127 family)
MSLGSSNTSLPITPSASSIQGCNSQASNNSIFWSRLRPIKATMATPWNYWKNEREMRRAIRALAEFDDHTLHDLGIRDRSQIEFAVRFCREC